MFFQILYSLLLRGQYFTFQCKFFIAKFCKIAFFCFCSICPYNCKIFWTDNIFQKIFTVIEEKPEFYLTLTSDDTRIGDIISKQVVYNYEIEYNDDTTLIGYDRSKGKKFILFPEAANKEGSDI